MNQAGVEYHNVFTYYLWWIVVECDDDDISRGYTAHEMLPSFGIGQLFGSVGSIGKELLRAGAHGIASGIFNVLGGGDFGNGFATGATASGLVSFAQGVKMRPGMMMLTTSVAGGVAAWATGGNFLKGALQGLAIGFFNHGMHGNLYYDRQGDLHGYLRQVICYGTREKKIPVEGIFGTTAGINMCIDVLGASLENGGGNSTFGSNGKFYFHTYNQPGFYGNKYVGTVKLTEVGKSITKYTGPIGKVLDLTQISVATYYDYQDYKNNGHTNGYNTVRASCSCVASNAGFYMGAEIGVIFGTPFGPAGIVIGYFVGGFAGSYLFSTATESAIDLIYGK